MPEVLTSTAITKKKSSFNKGKQKSWIVSKILAIPFRKDLFDW